MSGNEMQVQELKQALISAFGPRQLRAMVREYLGRSLTAITSGDEIDAIVFGLVDWATQAGSISELVKGATSYSPTNTALRTVASRYPGLLIDDTSGDRATIVVQCSTAASREDSVVQQAQYERAMNVALLLGDGTIKLTQITSANGVELTIDLPRSKVLSLLTAIKRGRLESIAAENATLTGADLSGINWDGAYLNKVILSDARLRGAKLKGAQLSGADLRKAQLRYADLRGVNLSMANLQWADLTGAKLDSANLCWADLRRADLVQAILLKTYLNNANLNGADLSDSIIDADFERASLIGADFTGACLFTSKFYWANLSEANLRGANIGGASFYEANLAGAQLEGTGLG